MGKSAALVLRGIADVDGAVTMAPEPDFSANRARVPGSLGPVHVPTGFATGRFNRMSLMASRTDANVTAFDVTVEATWDDPNDAGAVWTAVGTIDETATAPVNIEGVYPFCRVTLDNFAETVPGDPGAVQVSLTLFWD